MRYVLLYLFLSAFVNLAVAAASGDEGPGFDPNGRPTSLHVNADEGNGIDPHG
jgi:hypothetical protein